MPEGIRVFLSLRYRDAENPSARNCIRDRTLETSDRIPVHLPGVANVPKQPIVNLKCAFHKISRESTFSWKDWQAVDERGARGFQSDLPNPSQGVLMTLVAERPTASLAEELIAHAVAS